MKASPAPFASFSQIAIIFCSLVFLAAPTTQAQTATTKPAPIISDSDFDAALKKAKDTDNPLERQASLISVASRFQSVEVATQAGRNMWCFRTLNRRGIGIDAIRFTVPDGMDTHLYWAFSVPNLTSWYIIPVSGTMNGFADFYPQRKFRLPGVINDNLILQENPERLIPGNDYLIWFEFENDQPVQGYVSIVLLDEDRPDTDGNIADLIGLEPRPKAKPKLTKPKPAHDEQPTTVPARP